MTGLDALLASIGPEIEDYEEEVFKIFCHTCSSQNLGFVDASASVLEVTVGNHDFLIHQSPTILSSDRCGGTTGAVIWKITPLFATWMSLSSNLLFKTEILNSKSSVLELGCGISGITALALRNLVGSYLLTDQNYVMKLLNRNIEENSNARTLGFSRMRRRDRVIDNKKSKQADRSPSHVSNISSLALDWETDEIMSQIGSASQNEGFDVVLASDCVYNDNLIQPLVQTCADACKLRSHAGGTPTLCIVAQQLRCPEVFEKWLRSFCQKFVVWRIPDNELIEELRNGSGFIVHLGILK